jgi:hypothetical protein
VSRPQITEPAEPLGVPVPLVVPAGALDEAGALEAGPLAEVEVDGAVDVDSVGVGVGVGVGELELGGGDDGGLVGGVDVGGRELAECEGDVDVPPPDPLVPLGLSEGVLP